MLRHELAKKLYNDGMTYNQIAEKMGVTYNTVASYLRRPDSSDIPGAGGRALTADHVRDIRNAHSNGLTLQEIADIYEVSHVTISNIVSP